MLDLDALKQRRRQRSFANWDDFLESELVARSDESVWQLIDGLISLGAEATREQVQAKIDECVRRFNQLDQSCKDSWICTIEREDIGEVLWELIDLCGFHGSEEWLAERDW